MPGLDGLGVVERSGPGTAGKFPPGRRVVAVPWGTRRGNGSWAQYVAVPEAALVAVPDQLADDAACQFMVNPLTVYAFLDLLKVPEGEWLLSNAANSVLGRMLIALAGARGVRTVNLVRRREHMGELTALGADAVVVVREEDVVARVQEITGEPIFFRMCFFSFFFRMMAVH